MSYQVIARKYRPQKFADVVGQEHVTRTLGNAIAQNRIAHAYLFSGPRGTGKTTIARIFAKCLNCTDGPKVDFAEGDPRCEEIAEGRSLDVYEIDGASNNGVDQVRELRETCQYAPANAPYKIYIIDEVHMLSTAAFNALLKTLEEPPAHVKFMFATTDPEKVLPTILSRCQRFDLRRIPAGLIVEHLAMISKQEGVTIDEPALYAIARGADGGMRDAESTLDQLISFCGNTIQESDVLSVFGLTARGQIIDMAASILNGDVPGALGLLDELAKNGKDLSRLLSDLLAHFRNLLVFAVSRGDMGLLEVSEAEANALAEQAGSAPPDALTRVMEILSESEGRFRDATSKKILLEVALMKAIQGRRAMSIDAVLGKLQELRGQGGEIATGGESGGGVDFSAMRQNAGGEAAGKPAGQVAPKPVPAPPKQIAPAPASQVATEPAKQEASAPPPQAAPTTPSPAPRPTPAPRPAPAPTPAAPAAAAGSEVDLDALWPQIVETVGRASPFLKTYLPEAHPVSFQKNVLTVGFDPEFAQHLALVSNPRNQTLFQTKLKELGFHDSQVKFVEAEAPAHWKPAAPAADYSFEDSAPAASPAATPESAAPVPAPTEETAAPAPEPVQETALQPPAEPLAPENVQPMDMNEFKNDPLIKKALEMFRGQIVDVRS